MTTLQQLIDQCAAELDDPAHATFAAADVEQWCRDAIADYSLHFPRLAAVDVTTSAGQRRYDLEGNVLDIMLVEYPAGQDRPSYLRRRNPAHPRFWLEDGYYALVTHDDETAPAEIWISQHPADGELIRAHFQARHDPTIAAEDELTVRLHHQHVLKNYVIWRAALQLLHDEEAAPTSNSSLLMSQLAVNADRARRQYVDGLAKALFAVTSAMLVSWAGQDESAARIY